jgi:hypothetical protein
MQYLMEPLNVYNEYNVKFPHCKIEEDSGYELLKYPEGCFYIQHTDSFKAGPALCLVRSY